MSDSSTNPNLEYLEHRWRRNPGSRIYLQLAEEYRRLDRHSDAVDVLVSGLADRPQDLSGLVVLGRCQLELEQLDDAAESLDKVLQRDPAHMVANKLMVDVQLRRGDAERAQERLSFYRLLNDRDPEIDHFEYRLTQLRDEASAGVPREEDATTAVERADASPAVPDGQGEDAPSASSHGDIFALDALPVAPIELDLPRTPASKPKRQVTRINGLPFGDLPAVDGGAHWRTLAAGGLFSEADVIALGGTVSTMPTTASQGSAAETVPTAEATEPERSAPPDDAVGAEDQTAARMAGEDLAADVLAAEGIDTEDRDSEDRDSDVPDTEDRDSGDRDSGDRDDTEESVDAVPATVAMGDLYLEQGHPREAETVFRRVLAVDPNNQRAWAGLERVTEVDSALQHVRGSSKAASPVRDSVPTPEANVADETQAIDLVEAEQSAAAPARESEDAETERATTDLSRLVRGEALPEGITARKIFALQRYLSLIQQGRDHVS